jgi:hypothetical protein
VDSYAAKIACIEKLGNVLPSGCRDEFFDYFDNVLKRTLERPAKKERKSGLSSGKPSATKEEI